MEMMGKDLLNFHLFGHWIAMGTANMGYLVGLGCTANVGLNLIFSVCGLYGAL